MGYDWISFTTDYGTSDGFVAACEGVVARLAPAVRVLHVTHEVPPQDVRRGAAVLAQTVPHLPPAVHLAVVDPGVGTARRALLLATPGGVLVGPDNGLLVPAALALGGITTARELPIPPSASATFHGRDVFAPAAARAALGDLPGTEVDAATVTHLPAPVTTVEPGRLTSEVIGVDRFGNVQLAATDLPAGASALVRVGALTTPAVVGRTFADASAGDAVLLLDSAGHVAIAVNGGSAAARLGASAGDLAIVLVD